MRRFALVATVLLTCWACAAQAADSALEVRFYPDVALHPYPLEGRRGWQGLLLQNAAVVMRAGDPVTIERIELDVYSADEAVLTQRLGAAALERAATRGATLQRSGRLDALAFQFRPERLLGPGVHLAPTPRLEAASALLISYRFLAYNGAADRLRVRVFARRANGRALEAQGSIAVRADSSRVAYDFPLAGRWFVGAGQGLQDAHRWGVPEEFALDLVRLGDGLQTHRGTGATRTEYFAFDAPVLAAADGEVVSVLDSFPDSDAPMQQSGEGAEAYATRMATLQAELLARGAQAIAGNAVVLRHASGEYSLYAHLAHGSARVHPGDRVTRGQPIARLGTTGNSTEPHLHFQVMDGPDPLLSAGLPVRFRNVTLPYANEPRDLQSGDIVEAH